MAASASSPSTSSTTRPRISTRSYGFSVSMCESETRGSRRRFSSFTRPIAVLNMMRSPSRSIHIGVTCGDPSVFSVARCQKFGASTRPRTSSLSSTITSPFVRLCREQDRSSGHLPNASDRLAAERSDLCRVVDELVRLDADRPKAALELPRDRLERLGEARGAGGVGKAAARTSDELELVRIPAGFEQGRVQALEILRRRRSQRVEAAAVADEALEQAVVQRAAAEPQRRAAFAVRLGLEIDVREAAVGSFARRRALPPEQLPRGEVLVEQPSP